MSLKRFQNEILNPTTLQIQILNFRTEMSRITKRQMLHCTCICLSESLFVLWTSLNKVLSGTFNHIHYVYKCWTSELKHHVSHKCKISYLIFNFTVTFNLRGSTTALLHLTWSAVQDYLPVYHHFYWKMSAAGRRPPKKIAKTGLALLTSIEFPQPSPGYWSTMQVVCPRCVFR